MKSVGKGIQKLESEQEQDRQTDATEHITTPHSRMVKTQPVI